MNQIIGPSPSWALGMQRTGRQEMACRLRGEGPAAAAAYGRGFERCVSQWLLRQGFAPGFVFQPIPLPPIT